VEMICPVRHLGADQGQANGGTLLELRLTSSLPLHSAVLPTHYEL